MRTKPFFMGVVLALAALPALAGEPADPPVTHLNMPTPPLVLPAVAVPKVSLITDTQEAFSAVRSKTSNGGSCAPGTKAKFQSVSSDLPYFQLEYIAGGRAVPEECTPDDVCKSMLRKGLSFKVLDLAKATQAPENDDDSFFKKLKKWGKDVIKVGAYTSNLMGVGFALPVGQDQLTFFLNDMNQKISDKDSDDQKARDAANQMHGIFSAFLSCAGNTHANYNDGKGVALALIGLFNKMAGDPKIDMGDNNTAIQKAVSSGEALNKIVQRGREDIGKINTDISTTTLIAPMADDQLKPITNSSPAAADSGAASTSHSATNH